MHRQVSIALLALGAGFLAGCHSADRNPPGTIFVSGRIDGDPVDIAPKLPGRIIEITVREGDSVKAGQVVARMESPQDQARRDEAAARLQSARDRAAQIRLQGPILDERFHQAQLAESQAGTDAPARVAQAEAQVAAAQADLARVTADLEQNQSDAKRYGELAQKGAAPAQIAEQYATRVRTSQAAVEASKRQVAAAQANLAATRAALTTPQIRGAERETVARQRRELNAQIKLADSDALAAKAALDRVQADVGDLDIRAPVDGTIITRAAEPGRVVAAGTTILSMLDLSKLYLRAFVPEGQIGLVKIGQAAEVFLDSAPKAPLQAEVMRIDPQAMFTPENTYFQNDRVKQVVGVKLKIKSGYGAAKPGMPADGRIQVAAQS
jgi:HlyD family secretion protein